MEHMISTSSQQVKDLYPWIFEDQPTALEGQAVISMAELTTPLGPMLAGATTEGICLLEFTDRIRIVKEFDDLKKSLNAVILPGRNRHTDLLEEQLKEYFDGSRKAFTIPLHTPGNDFTNAVWATLREIPYGTTCSYKVQSEKMNNPKAIRAIAATNGRNRIAIIIPCHRVIGSNGSLTGYAGGIDKKKWLLIFERKHSGTAAGTLF
jgi:AraC family transcriptional regulator of adaptative response/methylated-DNA-[protein]-cysteine methyltransferase